MSWLTPNSIVALIMFMVSSIALGQLLPEGIGAYSLGFRKFSNDAQTFGSDGSLTEAGTKFNVDFTAENMASGMAGSKLKTLYDELRKFESKGVTDSLADELNFGEVRGDVTKSIEAKTFGMGYGFSDKITLYGGVPFVSASVDTKLTYTGTNNAAAIKSKLGDLVYKEIQDGLDKAATLSSQQVLDDLEQEKGYAPVEHWEYKGIGDTILGARTEFQGDRRDEYRLTSGLSLQLDLATGHSDDPDILTDIPIGRGYHAVTAAADNKITFTYLALGAKGSFTQGISRQVERRVPEGSDKVVGADRKASVQWTPGQDLGGGLYSTLGNSWIRGTYLLGVKKHSMDSYSGSLDGNYAALSAGTDKSQTFHEASILLTSVKGYARKEFAMPVVVTFLAHDTIAGINAPKETYFELTFMSFFSTPAASKAATEKKPSSKSPRATAMR